MHRNTHIIIIIIHAAASTRLLQLLLLLPLTLLLSPSLMRALPKSTAEQQPAGSTSERNQYQSEQLRVATGSAPWPGPSGTIIIRTAGHSLRWVSSIDKP